MISNLFRPVIAGMLVITAMLLTLGRVRIVTNESSTDEISYALRVATQDATAVMVDRNHMMDGIEMDNGNFRINLDTADEQFLDSFYRNVGAAVSKSTVNSMNLPLTGYVGYKYIYGELADGTASFPYSYTCVKNGLVYNFTMGDQIEVTDPNTGAISNVSLASLSPNFFHEDISNEDFRTITIMETISKFLTDFNSMPENLMVVNAGSGLSFTLGGVDYLGSDPSEIVEFSSVIDGPGYFAIADFYDPQLDGRMRTFTFGGAEYISKYV